MTDRELAPEPLRLVQELVNTAEFFDDGGHRDHLSTPADLRTWLEGLGFHARPTASDLRRVLTIREGLRALLEAHNGHPLDPDSTAGLNRALAAQPLHLTVGADGNPALQADGGMAGFVATISDAIVRASADGTWGRLKACRCKTCRWAFYDHSKNRCGTWCSMDECGSREKVRAYRRRKAGVTG